MNRLKIFDGPDMVMQISEAAGHEENHKTKYQSVSSTGMMFIQFMRLYNHGDDVAELKALIKYNKFIPECQTWLDLEKNTLMSPDKYGNNFSCSWLLSSNFGSYIILHFDHIYVSSKFL